jgi:aspartate aminotransferase
MLVAGTVAEKLENTGWIRRMFEEGRRLREERGPENIFDFSLGNPTEEPPADVLSALVRLAADPRPGLHGYMANAGFPDVRAHIAAKLGRQGGLPFTADDVFMTAGASAACNVILRAILDPGDEVIVLRPFFPDYPFYISNHGGKVVEVDTDDAFLPRVERIAAALTPRTRAILINSPNNPTGRIYPGRLLRELDALLLSPKRPVLAISDEPYREIVFDGKQLPDVASHVTNTAICYSWSKSQALAGERIGFLALSPRLVDREQLRAACVFSQRTLGYVNASALWQRLVGELPDVTIDIGGYERKRDRLCGGLEQIGYRVARPEGAFYVFAKTPMEDDREFTRVLSEHGILAVPGTGFGRPGYMRLSLTATLGTIEGSLAGFTAAFCKAVSRKAVSRKAVSRKAVSRSTSR